MTHRLVLPRGAVDLLRGLVAQLVDLHDDPPGDPAPGAATHPAWRRLYPSTTADPSLDRDLRALVHPDLVEGRREALALVGDALADANVVDGGAEEPVGNADGGHGGEEIVVGLGARLERVDLDDEQAVAMLGVVNDIRLALAATVALPDSLDDELPADVDDETRGTLQVVEWLAVVQEQVLASIAPLSQAHFDDPVHGRRDDAGTSEDHDRLGEGRDT